LREKLWNLIPEMLGLYRVIHFFNLTNKKTNKNMR